mmetsp:Transcript_28588/g.25303  ORF Transcript_28588/g.25303 Transcript_28588/m.25303 type:complete len:80 (+) Transcript_28588:217-456(+)
MLKLSSIKYEGFETDSATFIEEWVKQFDKKDFDFTDIVIIGGDGLFSQLINAIGNSPHKEILTKIPIGLIPGGSQNAIA